MRWRLGVHLDHQLQRHALIAQGDEPVEDGLPLGITGEVVVGDEEIADPQGGVGAHQVLDIVGTAVTGLAALHVDDGAEAAQVRAAAPGVEARPPAHGEAHPIGGQDRRGGAGHVRQIREIVVERLETVPDQILKEPFQTPLQLPGEQGDAQVQGLAQLHRHLLQHRKTTAHVEAANGHRRAGGAELAGQVQRPGELVRLNPNEPHQHPPPILAELPDEARRIDVGIGLVQGAHPDLHTRAQHLALGAVQGDTVHGGQAVRRQGGAPPLDHIAVVVVMRRLDPKDMHEVGWGGAGGHGGTFG